MPIGDSIQRLEDPTDREAPMAYQLDITATTDLSEIQRISQVVEEFCRTHHLPQALTFHLNFALNELLTNIINYGYEQGAADDQAVAIRITLDNTRLTTELRDRGRAFNPLKVEIPDLSLPVEQRPVGGLGIHLVRSLIDTLEYHREGDYNRLILRQDLPISEDRKGR